MIVYLYQLMRMILQMKKFSNYIVGFMLMQIIFVSCISSRKLSNDTSETVVETLPVINIDTDSLKRNLDSIIYLTDNALKKTTQEFAYPVDFATYSILRKHFNLGRDTIYYKNAEDAEAFFYNLYDVYFRDVSFVDIPEDTTGEYDFTKIDTFDIYKKIFEIPGGRYNSMTFCNQMPLPNQALYILYEYTNKSDYMMFDIATLMIQLSKKGCAIDSVTLSQYLYKLNKRLRYFTELRADNSIINEPVKYAKALALLLYGNNFKPTSENIKYLNSLLKFRNKYNLFSFNDSDFNGDFKSYELTLYALWAMCEWRSKL